jgi:hypothetical protein
MRSDQDAEQDEIEIDHLVVELPEGDDPLAGQAIADELLKRLSQLVES